MSAADWVEYYRYAKPAVDSIVNPKTGIREARRIATPIIGALSVQACEAKGGTAAEHKAAIAREVGHVLTQRAADVRASHLALLAPSLDRASAPADGFSLSP